MDRKLPCSIFDLYVAIIKVDYSLDKLSVATVNVTSSLNKFAELCKEFE